MDRSCLSTPNPHRFPRAVWKTRGVPVEPSLRSAQVRVSRAWARLYKVCPCSVDKFSARSETPAAQHSRPLVHIKFPWLYTCCVENRGNAWTKKHHALKRLPCMARARLSTPNPHRFPRAMWKTCGATPGSTPGGGRNGRLRACHGVCIDGDLCPLGIARRGVRNGTARQQRASNNGQAGGQQQYSGDELHWILPVWRSL